jgi:LEA14-like dessication related protein
MVRRLAIAAACALALVGCSPKGPEVRVLGVHEASRHEVVFVQVTNPASRSMRLTKLDYTFASQGATVSTGQVRLSRDVPAGAAVVLEVPLDTSLEGAMTLRGKLTAELDQIVRIFTVSAQVQAN